MEGFVFTWFVYTVSLLIVCWTSGALYYDVGRGSVVGGVLAIAWLALAFGTFVYWQPLWKPFLGLLFLWGVFLCWWLSLKPSNDRNWALGFTELARVEIEGDYITIENVRNTEYKTLKDCTPRYETRSYRLSELQGVDALLLHWGSNWMSYPMFVFDFGPDGRVCISIELRYRVGQQYSLFRSLYRQQELIFVVCDERDAILRRTKCLENHDLYLYRVDTGPIARREFFLEYANSINLLAAAPHWYHGLTNNCTTRIYSQGRGRMKWNWRMLINGGLDRFMYEQRLLDQELPFERLREQSWINEIANRAPKEGFGEFIRAELPGYQFTRS